MVVIQSPLVAKQIFNIDARLCDLSYRIQSAHCSLGEAYSYRIAIVNACWKKEKEVLYKQNVQNIFYTISICCTKTNVQNNCLYKNMVCTTKCTKNVYFFFVKQTCTNNCFCTRSLSRSRHISCSKGGSNNGPYWSSGIIKFYRKQQGPWAIFLFFFVDFRLFFPI